MKKLLIFDLDGTLLNTLEDLTTDYFEEALEEIFTLANNEYLNEEEMYNILIEGVSIFTAKLISEIQKGNELLNVDDDDNLDDENDDIKELDENQTQ